MRNRLLALILFGWLGAISLWAQLDSLPLMVGGSLDFAKNSASTVKFNPKDVVMGIIRAHHLTGVFAVENQEVYLKDFHFMDVNYDGFLDVIYSGQTHHYGGWHTLVFLSRGRLYDLVLDSPGYPQQVEMGKDSLGFRLFRPGTQGVHYLSETIRSEVYLGKDTIQKDFHTVLFPGGGELPAYFTHPDAVPLVETTYLRFSPLVNDSKGIDLNGDGTVDTKGNIIATYLGGALVFRIGSKQVGGEDWSFIVVVEGVIQEGHILYGLESGRKYVAGWVPTNRLGIR